MGLRIRLCWALGPALFLGMAGCSNDASPDDPVVLGVPPDTAYLGVEYAYNFGAYGGDDVLDFSLVNAPAWLGFEDTANKARAGVILRGVPGVTGGRRGEEDLGSYNRISVNATDGSRLGGNYFDITVEHNPLSVVDANFTEGETYWPDAANEVLERAKSSDFEADKDSTCLPPDISETGTYTARDVPLYDDLGGVTVGDRLYDTHPVVVAVTLAHPSVEPVTVAFELESSFSCDAGAAPDECEYGSSNRDDAKPLEDFVANSGTLAPPPDYLAYTNESEGVLTFEPGKTTCFIRLEVLEDRLPELTEEFRLELTEVREGLATLSANGAESTAELRIQDNEPTVSFEPGRVIISETAEAGAARAIVARLDKRNDTGAPIKIRVRRDNDASTADDADYALTGADDETGNAVTIEIPEGERETTFLVKAFEDPAGLGEEGAIEDAPDQLDDILTLISDVDAQFGRENYARAGDASVTVVINEWTQTLDLSAYGDFIPTALVSGTYGELYVAGVMGATDAGSDELGDESGNQAVVFALDRLGQAVPGTMAEIYASTGTGTRIIAPKIDFTERTDPVGATRVLTRNLAVGYTVETGNLAGETAFGGEDLGIGYLQLKSPASIGDFSTLWQAQLGSSADDQLVDVRTNSTLGVVFGANTQGNWPLSDRESYRGAQDTVLGRLLCQAEASAPCGDYTFNWARMIGTSGNDRLAAAPVSGGGAIFASGETTGALEPDRSFGGTELFYIRTDTGNLSYITQQYGTSENDTVSDAAYIGTTIWTAGSNRISYEVLPGGVVGSDTLPNNSRNPYVLVFTANEAAIGSISLKGSDTGDENVHAIDGIDDYAIIGGDTDGTFEPDLVTQNLRSAILASVRLKDTAEDEDEDGEKSSDEEEGQDDDAEDNEPRDVMQVDWRYQMSDVNPTRIVDVEVSRNGKVFALVERGAGEGYFIVLIDDRGERLDQ